MTLPNFIVIGAAKCGTTSICDLLAGHPAVFFSDPKEPRFFSDRSRYGTSRFRADYESLFEGVRDETAVGEGTTTYTHPEVAALSAERIATEIPGCRLIFMARHPVRRLESDWRMRCFEGWAPEDINDAIGDNESLITHSLYQANIAPYRERFDSSQLHVMFLEDLANESSRERELEACMKFLGIDSSVRLTRPGERRNDSRNFRRDGAMASLARRTGLLPAVRAILPQGLVRGVRRVLTRELPYEPRWRPDVLEYVTSRIEDDARRFLESTGKASDFWKL